MTPGRLQEIRDWKNKRTIGWFRIALADALAHIDLQEKAHADTRRNTVLIFGTDAQKLLEDIRDALRSK